MNKKNPKKSDLHSVEVERRGGVEVNGLISMIPSEIETRLISELELESFPTGYRKEILEKCWELIGNNIMIRILEELSDQDHDDFNAFLEKEGVADPQAIFAFLSARLPNLDLIVKESFEERLKKIKPIYKDLNNDLKASVLMINKKYERIKLISKIVCWAVGWLFGWLVCYILSKFGLIPLDWVIPKWVQKIFQ